MKRHTKVAALLPTPACSVMIVLLIVLTPILYQTVNAQTPCTKSWPLDAEFDAGTMHNVNYVSHDKDQLQLQTTSPFVYIACSGRGTVVRINVNTGAILGEYRTAPAGMDLNPTRTAVDRYGNVWVANSDENGVSPAGYDSWKGSVARIALVMGGLRVNADKTPNPTGQYLMPPFIHSTAIDRDGDGLIKTSRGLGNILPWTNDLGADTHGGVATADDECIINYTRVTGTRAQSLAVDANNDVWVGGSDNLNGEKLSGVTGQPVPGTQYSSSCGGDGAVIDGAGTLWSAGGTMGLLRFVPNAVPPPAGTQTCLSAAWGYGKYGLAVDPNTDHIWHAYIYGDRISELAANGTVLHTYAHGDDFALGVAVDKIGNVWVAHGGPGGATTVGHLRTDGTFVGNVNVGSGPTGVAVDANGKVWVANYYSNNAMRIDPNGGSIGGGGYKIGAVDMTVSLGSGASPFNYNDMTGAVALRATSWHGIWTVAHNSDIVSADWGKISWTATTPGTSSVTVEARAAATEARLSAYPFVAVTNGVSFCNTGSELTGQYIEIRVRLIGDAAALPNPLSPVLHDLIAELCDKTDPVLSLNPDAVVNRSPNHKYVTLTVSDMVNSVSDNCATLAVSDVQIYSVWSDEPENIVPGGDDGNTINDIVIAGDPCASVDLRKERIGRGGNGRVYTVTLKLDDGSGNTTTAQYRLSVPHDRSGTPAVDDGWASGYTVNSDCSGLPKIAGHISVIPDFCTLGQNYPNPFNPVTVIDYSIAEAGRVTLKVYDIFGREIATLVEEDMIAGSQTAIFDGTDMASGTYLYVLGFNGVMLQNTMNLIK